MQTSHTVSGEQAMRKRAKVKKKSTKEPSRKKRVGSKTRALGKLDTAYLLIILVLLAFGMIMLFSASYANALYKYKDSLHFVKRQGLFVIFGIIAMLLISRIDYRIYKKFTLPIFVLGIVLLIVVLAFEKGGVHRWIIIGSYQFQPSEYMKFAIIITFAMLISKNYEKMNTFRYGVFPFLLILGLVCGLMMMEPHLSGTLIIAGIAGIMMFIGGTKPRYFAMLIPLMALGIIGIIVVKDVSYMTSRIQNWQNPFDQEDIRGAVWQTCQSLIAIGSGGFMGVGLGNSTQKYLYLPEPQNDFIFAIVCEELGLVGAILVILLFVLLVYRGFSIANKAPDKFGALLAIGITLQIGLQALLNIAVVTNSIPNTGISLPFFSYGGTSLMMLLGEIGILLNISRHSTLEKA